jgi:hypothetical protein
LARARYPRVLVIDETVLDNINQLFQVRWRNYYIKTKHHRKSGTPGQEKQWYEARQLRLA